MRILQEKEKNNSSMCTIDVHYIENMGGCENKARALRQGVTVRKGTGTR